MRVLVIHGPISDGPLDLDGQVSAWGEGMGLMVDIRQSDDDSRVASWIRQYDGDGIVICPAGIVDTRAIVEAVGEVDVPVVGVHTGMMTESPLRHVTVRMIFGRGATGYRDAMRHLVNRLAMPFETVRYGTHTDNVGDVRGEGDELVVLVHGGLWRQEYERDQTESLAVDLARRGFRTLNLEYRRFGDGGGWPGSGDDVLSALDSIPRLGLDASRVSVIGHSAGSYLLMWAAAQTGVEIELHLALGPLLDLETAIESGDVGAEECGVLLGGGAPDVSPGAVRTVLVHGDADQIVPVQRSVDFSERHSLELHRGSFDHFSVLDPTKPEWNWVLARLGSH